MRMGQKTLLPTVFASSTSFTWQIGVAYHTVNKTSRLVTLRVDI